MNSSVEQFGRISSFGPSAPMLVLILASDVLFTGIHVWQEWRGETFPLFRAFGAIVGLRLPWGLGVLFFTLILAVVQWGLGLIAYAGWLPFLGVLSLPVCIKALGGVLGARVSDTIISHWTVFLAGYRPNPGLSSTGLYVLEAIVILVAFRRGLALDVRGAWIGFGFGFLAFLIVIPFLALLRAIIKPWRRGLWVRGERIPEWAADSREAVTWQRLAAGATKTQQTM